MALESPYILGCVVGYLLVCFLIGAWAMGRTHSISDFLVAGQTLGPVVVVVAAISSVMSGFGFVGGPGLVFEAGMSSLWMTFVAPLGAGVSWILLAKRLRLLSEAREVLTLADAVAARYGEGVPRLLMGLAVLLGVLGYLGTQIMALGFVLRAVLNVELPLAMAIGVGVLAFYSVAGGIIAGVYTDLFQGVIMAFAAVAVCWRSLEATGGMAAISETLWQTDPALIGPWGDRGPLTALSWYLLFALGAVGQPQAITKFLMLKDVRDLRWGALLFGAGYVVLSLLWMSVGLAMRALVERGAQAPLASPDEAAPAFLLSHTPEWLAGIVFAGLLAAIMSTADSFVNIGAAAVVRDIPTALFGRPAVAELFWTRVATGLLLAASAVFALYMENLVALLGTFGWGTFAAAIVPSVALGLNWKRATRAGCVASIIVSLLLNFALELAARFELYQVPGGVATGCVALLASLAAFIFVSLLTPPPLLHDDVAAVMDL
ncbi:MAG: sodium/proline symporter [Acidobacteria bacterium]|nr:sodium/proline symporter [Acidobacteriota bacterium]